MSTEAMREAFEKSYATKFSPDFIGWALERRDSGEYKMARVEEAWEAWQAATANQEELIKAALDAAAEKCEKLKGSASPNVGFASQYDCADAIRQITPQQVMARLRQAGNGIVKADS